MLDTIKAYIKDIPDVPFDEFYQRYICYVQDINVQTEINNIQSDEVMSLIDITHRLKPMGFSRSLL